MLELFAKEQGLNRRSEPFLLVFFSSRGRAISITSSGCRRGELALRLAGDSSIKVVLSAEAKSSEPSPESFSICLRGSDCFFPSVSALRGLL